MRLQGTSGDTVVQYPSHAGFSSRLCPAGLQLLQGIETLQPLWVTCTYEKSCFSTLRIPWISICAHCLLFPCSLLKVPLSVFFKYALGTCTLIGSPRAFCNPVWAAPALTASLCVIDSTVPSMALHWGLSSMLKSLICWGPRTGPSTPGVPHQCWAEWKDHFSPPAGNTLLNATW